jgi:thiol-disulfide isomerase/thioredoxin
MKQLLLIFAFIAVSVTSFGQQLQPVDLPNAVFYKANGSKLSTMEFPKNKKSLLIFFDATCPHCQRVVANLSKQSSKLNKVNLYLISLDEFRSINYFMNNFGKPLLAMKNVTLLRDGNYAFIPTFHPRQYPSLYLYGTNRKLILFSSNEEDVAKFLSLIQA